MNPRLKPNPALTFPLTRQTVSVHIIIASVEVDHFVYEGEVEMSQQQADAYRSLIGDGLGRVSVTKELSEMNFGNGGKTMVSVSLTCDQSEGGINTAIVLADQVATFYVDRHHDNMRQLVAQRGIGR